MSKDDFNEAGKIHNEYTLKLRADCGGRKQDPDPMHQAEVFRTRLFDWLEKQGEHASREALTTATLGPSADGFPQVRLVCTEDCLARMNKKFGHVITGTTLVHANIGAAQPKPGSIYPKDKNCWDPRKWKNNGTNKP